MKENNSFISFENDVAGVVMDDSKHKTYPIIYYNVIDGIGIEPEDNCSYYIYTYKGGYMINSAGRPPQVLSDGMYGSIHGKFELSPITNGAKAVVIEVLTTKGVYPQTRYTAPFVIGGPIENEGRLNYIDGCTDSLLIPPVKLGDPCFNHLHFPTNIDQTQHTHPSHRIGIVAKGEGKCITPFGNLPLTTGMIFIIKEWDGKSYGTGLDGKEYPVGQHAFETRENTMDVIAFHPDSDFGATDIFHPMINRTIVDGKPASNFDEILTKK